MSKTVSGSATQQKGDCMGARKLWTWVVVGELGLGWFIEEQKWKQPWVYKHTFWNVGFFLNAVLDNKLLSMLPKMFSRQGALWKTETDYLKKILYVNTTWSGKKLVHCTLLLPSCVYIERQMMTSNTFVCMWAVLQWLIQVLAVVALHNWNCSNMKQ